MKKLRLRQISARGFVKLLIIVIAAFAVGYILKGAVSDNSGSEEPVQNQQ